jgi:hypothetical protein
VEDVVRSWEDFDLRSWCYRMCDLINVKYLLEFGHLGKKRVGFGEGKVEF